jgi:hypothetical protein
MVPRYAVVSAPDAALYLCKHVAAPFDAHTPRGWHLSVANALAQEITLTS